jgi:hypothetical protein
VIPQWHPVSDDQPFMQFSLSAALAVGVCSLCSAIIIEAHMPIPPLLSVAAVGGGVCAVSLTGRSWMPAREWLPRFVGSIVGVALSVAAAVISQSLQLTP